MSKWKRKLSMFLVALFTLMTFAGNVPAQASKINTAKNKKVSISQKNTKNNKNVSKVKNKKVRQSAYSKKNYKKGQYNSKGKSKKIVKNKEKVVVAKPAVKKLQKLVVKKTTKKAVPEGASKTPKVITFVTPGVIRGGKSITLLQNITGDAKFTAEKITYNNANISGDLYILADNCNFNNVNVKGNVYVDPGEKGNSTLNNITCSDLKILSGGKNSIHLNNVKVNKELSIEIKKIEKAVKEESKVSKTENKGIQEPIRVEIKGQTSIQNTQVSSSAILDVVGGSFGNINVSGTTVEKNVVEFKGIFDKTVSVQAASTIKTASGAVLPEIQIVPENKISKIVLDGNFKNVLINKESNLDIAPKANIENLIVNVKSGINVDKTANVKKVDDKFKCVNITNVTPPTPTTKSTTSNEVTVNIRVEGYDHTIIPTTKVKAELFNLQPYLGKASGSSATRSKGWDVSKFSGPTVAHVIARALKDKGITYDLQDYGWSCYMAMIDGDREKAKGDMSGWMYRVNGQLPNIGCQAYTLKGGENIVFYYGSYGFDTLYTMICSDKNKVNIGEEVTVTLQGETNDYKTYESKREPISDATILVNGNELSVNGKTLKTDSDGKAVLKFDRGGKYSITATRIKTKGKESGYKDIVKPDPEIITVGKGSGSGSGSSSSDDKVDSISFDNNEIQIAIGEIKQLINKIKPENASNKKIKWKSSDENAVKVDINGKVTGIKIGEATITATTEDGGKTASCKVKVLKEINISEVKINNTTVEVQEGGISSLIATVLPENATNKKIAWKSSDENIAKVDVNGKVTGLKEGEATVTVTTDNGGKTASCKVKVTKPASENAAKYNGIVTDTIAKACLKVVDFHCYEEWAIVGLARGNRSDLIYKDYLQNKVKFFNDPENVDLFKQKPTEYERITLGVLSASGDPTNVGGSKINLIEKICNADLEKQGINAFVFGLIAIDTKNYKEPDGALWTREKLIKAILDKECSNKESSYKKTAGWAFGGDNADPDMTGMAVTALAPYYNKRADVKEAIDRAVEWISWSQKDDGGYASWGTTNSESCAQVIMGLCALGIDPTGPKFTKNGKNAIDALLIYKCEDGSFAHITKGMGSGPNPMATEQALYALEQFKYFLEGKGRIYNWEENTVSDKDVKITEVGTKLNDKTLEGDLYIQADNCEVNNITVKGTIYVDPGKEGSTNISNTVTNDLKVLSGGKNSIHLDNVTILKNLTIDTKGEPVRVEIKGKTNIPDTQVKSSALLEVTGGSFGEVKVSETKGENTTIEFKGTFDKSVTVESKATIKVIENAVIPSVKIEAENKDVKVVLEGNIKNVEINKEAKVELNGSFSNLSVNKEAKIDLKGETKVDTIKVSSEVSEKVEINKSEKAEIKNVEDKNKKIEMKNDTSSTGGDTPSTGGDTNKQIKIEFKGNKNIKVGDKPQLKANIIDPSIKDKKIVWISSDEKIAKVDDTGKVITMGPGTVVIAAAIEGNESAKDNIEFNVKENKVKVHIRVEAYDHTIIPREEIEVSLMDLQPLLGKASGSSGTASKGWGVDKFDGPTAAHATVEALINHGFTRGTASDNGASGKGKFDIQDYGWSCYIAMIDGDREKAKGIMSGWMYKVDGVLPGVGCQGYSLKGGEDIVWYYGSYGYNNIYTEMKADKTNVETGENVRIKMDGYSGPNNNQDPLVGATILVNGQEYKNIKTNSRGEAILSFDAPGTYKISANRTRKEEPEAGYIDIVRPIPIIITVEAGTTTPPSGGDDPTPSTVPVRDVKLNINTSELKEGDVLKLTATVQPENATNKNGTWKSSNESIAKVDANGKVTAVVEGTVTITVTTQDGMKTANCIVIVKKKDSGTVPEDKNDELLKVTDEKSDTSLLIQKNKDNTITMLLEGKTAKNDTIVTITLFNPDNDLKYIGQAVIKDGKLEFKTSLEAGKYLGFYNVQNSNKVKITEFEVK